MIAAIWSDVFGRRIEDITEHFLDVGGHSLMLVQILARVREAFGADISLETFFENDTIERQAAVADAVRAQGGGYTDAISPDQNASRYPLSFSQERVCFLEMLAPGNTAYMFRTIIRVEGQLQLAPL